MRHLLISSVIALVLAASSPAWAEESYRVRVDGLACPFCAFGIEKKFKNTAGVEGVEIRINEGVVLVTVTDDADFDKVRARRVVKDAGFTMRGFEKVEGR